MSDLQATNLFSQLNIKECTFIYNALHCLIFGNVILNFSYEKDMIL